MLQRPYGGARWKPSCQAAPGGWPGGWHLTVCTQGASNQNCQAEPFLSSWPMRSWAKVNDYVKPLSVVVICYTAIAKGTICEWNPKIIKSQNTFFPLHNYFSFIISAFSMCVGHSHAVAIFKGLKRACWSVVAGTPKANLTQSTARLNHQVFEGGLFKWVEKRQIPMSCGLKSNYFFFKTF